jgi:hypothetical protein
LSNKFTYLAYKISYRKISEINVKAKFFGFHFHVKFCSEKPLTTSVLWKNFDQKVVSAGKWGMVAGKLWIFCDFDVHFASVSVWKFAFLRNVWAFHFCSIWILTTTAFHSPKVHFHGVLMLIFCNYVCIDGKRLSPYYDVQLAVKATKIDCTSGKLLKPPLFTCDCATIYNALNI